MTVIVTGDRYWWCDEFADRVCKSFAKQHGPSLTIRHGACPTGVDACFASACLDLGIRQDPMPADWSLGKRGGPVRNTRMVLKGADLCLAFHRDFANSRGTLDCAARALTANIPTWLVPTETGLPHRLSLDDPRFADWIRRNSS